MPLQRVETVGFFTSARKQTPIDFGEEVLGKRGIGLDKRHRVLTKLYINGDRAQIADEIDGMQFGTKSFSDKEIASSGLVSHLPLDEMPFWKRLFYRRTYHYVEPEVLFQAPHMSNGKTTPPVSDQQQMKRYFDYNLRNK